MHLREPIRLRRRHLSTKHHESSWFHNIFGKVSLNIECYAPVASTCTIVFQTGFSMIYRFVKL